VWRLTVSPKLHAQLGLVLLFLLLLGGSARAREAEPALEPLAIVTTAGVVRFEVEVARRAKVRERGLMFRQSLAPDRGMLFLFGSEQRLSFWMKNTYLSLDMIFIRKNGRIAAVVVDTVPLSEASISPDVRVSAVLEVNAGTAKRLHIAVGDEVRHEAFGTNR
jgi:uncharacterized membrane protein (UPF0127 family)